MERTLLRLISGWRNPVGRFVSSGEGMNGRSVPCMCTIRYPSADTRFPFSKRRSCD